MKPPANTQNVTMLLSPIDSQEKMTASAQSKKEYTITIYEEDNKIKDILKTNQVGDVISSVKSKSSESLSLSKGPLDS